MTAGVREAETRDLPGIAAIYAQGVRAEQTAHIEPPSAEWWDAWLEGHPRDRRPVLVAERAGVIIGWLSLGDYRPGRGAVAGTAEVSFYVDVDHHRGGVASTLLAAALHRATSLQVHTLIAILLADNAVSIAFLERHGFERWGDLPDVARFGDRRVGHVYYGRTIESGV